MNKHPSKDIIGIKDVELIGKKIVICISGSVASSECPKIARELMRYGAEIYTVMTPSAQELIHPNLMEWATGNDVVCKLTGKLEHISLCGNHSKKADLVLIFPATANTINKIACGIDDTTVTTIVSTAIGSKIPILIAPAMHNSLYNHPILLENIKKLKSIGIEFIGPKIEEGKAKIEDIEQIIGNILRKLTTKDMKELKILVTAGSTIEYIDPVRIMTNKSSGKMGFHIANIAQRRGAEITLVSGFKTNPSPYVNKNIKVETTKQMLDSVIFELKENKYDIVISTSAVADYTPIEKHNHKISSKEISKVVINLKSLPKIIEEIKKIQPQIFLVAFKAEYKVSHKALIGKSYQLIENTGAELVIANDVGKKDVGFEYDTNEVFIINKKKEIVHIPLSNKKVVAGKILDIILKEYYNR